MDGDDMELAYEIFSETIENEDFADKELINQVIKKAIKNKQVDPDRGLKATVAGIAGGGYGGSAGMGVAQAIKAAKGDYFNTAAELLPGGAVGAAIGATAGVLGRNALRKYRMVSELKRRLANEEVSDEDMKKYLSGTLTPAMKRALYKMDSTGGARVGRSDN